ncbi:EI24 domain-containing protein [Altererythrobacter sp. H2]|uniref:EI24 domain-containing protein n=1 Tax=Altererythrobacter sp. H2 TaxID=3108391 RepID=UPI002B4BE8F4|nr:EI24 domain-containing protein [Altererythrobacter sp. H2]WRK95929.1 EI24 domain-containing protein [Altererythrobacter sp. H2]
MNAALSALLRALPQLADGPVLRILLKTVFLTVAVFAVVGLAAWYGLSHLLAQWDAGTVAAGLSGLIAAVLTVIGGWLLFRLVAVMVLQFFAEDIVAAVEARHYPLARQAARPRSLGQSLGDGLRSLARALLVNLAILPVALVLLVTGVGTALLFWLVNGWLLGRELTEMVWLRHSEGPEAKPPVTGLQRFALGGFVAALMAVPFVNLLVPVLGAAAATHLVHRRPGALSHA